MSMDSSTEIISHFIGIFDQVVEAARMRAGYEEFSADKAAHPDAGPLLNISINVTSPFVEDSVDVGLPEFWSPPPVGSLLPPSRFTLPELQQDIPFVDAMFFGGLPVGFGLPLAGVTTVIALNFMIPPPSSMATVNLQNAFLWDDDFFSNVDLGVEFTETSVFHSALQVLKAQTEALQILEFPAPPADGESFKVISDMIVLQAHEAEAPDWAGVEVYFAKGSATSGVTENGVEVETAISFKDVLPDILQADEEPEGEAPLPLTGDEDTSAEAIIIEEYHDDDDGGHELVTGGNMMVNEAFTGTNWLDAPIIAVMGDFVSVDVISQVNVYNDMDTFHGTCNGAGNESTTQAVNSAAFSLVSNPIIEPLAEGEVAAGGSGPAHVAVTRIDGDVVNVNYTQQYAFAYDNDIASVQFTASETYIMMGGNTVFNSVSLVELGFYYDLIVCGGSMYDISMIMQTNILLDADNIYLESHFDGQMETSGNLLMNQASLTTNGVDTVEDATEDQLAAVTAMGEGSDDVPSFFRNEDVFQDVDVLRVLYISGNIIDLQVMDQTNVLGDADQVAVAAATLASETGADIEVTTGGNALLNTAVLAEGGIDSTVYAGGEGYSDALLYQAELVDFGDPLDGLGTGNTDLASEAVVFLAEGMTSEAEPEAEAGVPTPDYGEAPVDVMQSILA